MGTENSLSTISCEGLRSPWRGEGSAAIRTRGAAIRVLVRGQQISDEAADQEGAHPLADEGDRNSPLKAKASARPQEIVSFELHLQAATKPLSRRQLHQLSPVSRPKGARRPELRR